MEYSLAKKLTIDIVDDFTKKVVCGNYGPSKEFNAKTKLDDLGISDPVRAVMPWRINKVFGKRDLDWSNVGPLHTVKCVSIGDVIRLICRKAKVDVPEEEPT